MYDNDRSIAALKKSLDRNVQTFGYNSGAISMHFKSKFGKDYQGSFR